MHPSVRETAVFQGLMHRRSVREFAATALDRETVEALLDAAVHAPTAMHRQPWRFVVIQDRDQLRRYSDRAKALLRAQADRPGETPHPELEVMLADPAYNIFYDGSTVIVICRADRHDRFGEADCWLAAENLMLAADAAGLGTCCIGLALDVLQQPDVKTELGIPDAADAVAAVLVGVPRNSAQPTPRQPPHVLSWWY